MSCLKQILIQALKDVFPSFIKQFKDVEVILRNRLKPSFHEMSELYLDEHPDIGSWRYLYLFEGMHKKISNSILQALQSDDPSKPCFENPEMNCNDPADFAHSSHLLM